MSRAGLSGRQIPFPDRLVRLSGVGDWFDLMLNRIRLTISEGGKKKRKSKTTVAPLASGSFPYHPEEEYIDKVPISRHIASTLLMPLLRYRRISTNIHSRLLHRVIRRHLELNNLVDWCLLERVNWRLL